MKSAPLARSEHKFRTMEKIAGAELDDFGRFLLLNCVETYLQLSSEEEQEYQRLLARETAQEVVHMQMTWADKLEAKGRQEGRQEGRQRGLQEALLRLSEQRFGALPAAFRQRVETIDSDEKLTHLLDLILLVKSRQELDLG